MPKTFQYRVVTVDKDGNQTATVGFDEEAYAEKLWHRANTIPSVWRCWIERRTLSDWSTCSSETGGAFMALRPASRDQQEMA